MTAVVLVVGAGPTGLTLANALAAWGVPFTLVDCKSGPSRDSKALALNMASQLGLETIGLGGKLGRAGGRIARIEVKWRGQRLFGVDFRRLSGTARSFIAQPQAVTESELAAALVEQGHAVAWHTRVLDLACDRHGVEVSLEHAGLVSRRRYDYVVGCDGKHSVVRSRMQVNFTGYDYPMHFVLGDFLLERDAPEDCASYHVFDDSFFILVPMGGKMWRVVVKHDGPVPAHRPVDAREITDTVRAHLGADFFGAAPVWISRAPFYMRTCDRLRAERLFLAGDAAHLFSPVGGTGMNTGIQDALNLAWKLAYRVRGGAPDALLDRYQHERLEAIQANAAATDQLTRLIARLDPDPAKIAHLLPTMRNRGMLRNVLPRLYSGLGGGQLFAAISALRATLAVHAARCGLPPLLALARLRVEGEITALAELQTDFADCLRLLAIVPDQLMTMAAIRYPHLTLRPAGDALAALFNIAPGSLLLVAPDGTVAFSGQMSDCAQLRRAVEARAGAPHPVAARARAAASS